MSEFIELPQSLEDISAYVQTPDALERPPAPAPSKSSEELLVEMLLAIEGDSISLDAFQFLFELLEDYSREYHMHSAQKLNSFFQLLFQLLLASDALQLKVIKQLNSLLVNHAHVRQFAKDTEWLTHLLQFLPNFEDVTVLDELLIVIELLAKHHISAKQVSMIFQLLQHEKPAFKAYCWTHIFQLLQRLWHGRAGKPDDYFELDGVNSGLTLPPFKLPASGYSFCTWVCIDGFVSPFVKDAYVPYLFSFLTEDQLGVEAFFTNNMLTFKCAQSTNLTSSRNQVKTSNYTLKPRQWYFICCTHTANFIRSDELIVYIDGNVVANIPLAFPKLDKHATFKNCRLGIQAGPASPKYALRGEMAGFAFFEDLLSHDDVKSLHHCGPNLFGSLREMQDALARQGSNILQKRPKLMFMYTPSATHGPYCTDPLNQLADRRATKLDGARECLTTGIQESLYSIGGIQLLLPLFSTKYRPKLSEPIDVNVKVISLIAELIKNNPPYQSQLLETRFFEIMGHLLADAQFAKQNVWSPQAVVSLEELSRALYSFENPSSHTQATDFSVQKILLHSIYSHVKKDPDYFHNSLLSVDAVLTILAEHYSYPLGDKPRDADSSRLPRPNLLELRWMILEIIRAICSKGLSLPEVRSIVAYLQEECHKPDDRRLVVDVLQVMLTFYSDQHAASMTPHLQKLGNFKPFLPLLQTDNERQRVWTLKAIGKLYQASLRTPTQLAPEEIVDNLICLKNVLQPFSFTYNIYSALLEILLDSISIESFDSPVAVGQAAATKKPLVLKNLAILQIIFELLSKSDIELKTKVVRDFVLLLQSSSDNRVNFLSSHNWQRWLFSLIAIGPRREAYESQKHNPGDVYNPLPAEQKLIASVNDIVALLLEHSLFQVEQGSTKVFEQTTSFLAFYRTAYISFDASLIAEGVTSRMMRTLVENTFLISRCSQSVYVWQNCVHFLFFVEEFMFNLPPVEEGRKAPLLPLQVVHDARGVWRGFTIAQKLLEFLDPFVQIKFANPFEMDDKSKEIMEKLEERARRFQLRLVLYSIRESGSIKNAQRLKFRKDSFSEIKDVVESNFKNFQSIQNSLARYLRKKTQQWDLQMSDVDIMSQKNLKRVKDICIVAKSNSQALYLISFVHSVMRQPDVQKDEAYVNLISALFEVMALNVKTRLSDTPQGAVIAKAVGDELVAFFKDGLDNLLTWPFGELVLKGVETVVAEEIQLVSGMKEGIVRRQAKLREAIKDLTSAEADRYTKLSFEFETFSTTLARDAQDSRSKFKIRLTQYSMFIASEWKYMLRLMTESRGPWNSPTAVPEKVYWRLDTGETRSRMRIKLKREYGDMSVLEKASQINTQKQQQVPFSPSSPQIETPASASQTTLISAALPTPRKSFDEEERPDEDILPPEAGVDPQASSPDVNETRRKAQEKTIYVTCAEFIKGITAVEGDFEITSFNINFRNIEEKTFKTIPMEKVSRVFVRRYMLRTTALEIFTVARTNHFFNFNSHDEAKLVLKHIVAQRPINLGVNYFSGHPSKLMKSKSRITEMWRKREMSNFDYLMELNTIAGRSYNDLGQYPVFPWVIADYTSKKLDLNAPDTFRDLSKPVGALNEKRLESFIERRDNFNDPNIPSFLYGSHYSTLGIVLYYLVRLDPFSTHFVNLQGGTFDHPARMFWSIPQTWQNCLINSSDVKELIPEFFYQPEFLINSNHLNMGRIASANLPIDDVQLPPWADNAHSFVQQNRAALESDYVSAHLHEWIDLIFGYKQVGAEAEEANNVFYYLTYEGAVDIDAITDPVMRQSVLGQIKEFGQTPCQLFTQPHPARYSMQEAAALKQTSLLGGLLSPLTSQLPGGLLNMATEVPTPAFLGKVQQVRPRTPSPDKSVLAMQIRDERLLMVFRDGLTFSFPLKAPSKSKKFPISFGQSPEYELISSPQKLKEHDLEMLFSSSIRRNRANRCVAITPDGKYFIHCGNWDSSIVVSSATDTSQSFYISEHKDVVTCLAITADGSKLVTGSKDCNCFIWDMDSVIKALKQKDKASIKPAHMLCGHYDTVNCVAVNSELDVVVTASKDKTCIVSSLSKARYARTIQHDGAVTLICLSTYGDLITYCPEGEILYLHTVNGRRLRKIYNAGKISAMKLSPDGNLLITAGEDGGITVRTLYLYSLKRIWRYQVATPVTSLELMNGKEYLFAGLADGSVLCTIFDMSNLLSDMCTGK